MFGILNTVFKSILHGAKSLFKNIVFLILNYFSVYIDVFYIMLLVALFSDLNYFHNVTGWE